ncbi:MAG: flippase-like domain-containing protein [bacterium]|nr:flippase-like domain-containing protein [bacterium]
MNDISLDQNVKKTFFQHIKSTVWLLIKFAIALGIIGWIISGHYTEFKMAIQHIDYNWLIAGLLFFAVTQIAAAYRWYLLLKIQNINVSFFETLSLAVQGTFFSLVIPGGAMGGDLVRTSFLLSRTPKGNKLAATSTVFMDRFMGMFGQFSISIIVAIFFIPEIKAMHNTAQIAVVIILIVSVIGIVCGMGILMHKQLEKIRVCAYLKNLVDDFTKGFVTNTTDIIDVYNKSKRTMVYCVLIGIVFVQINMSLILFFIAKGLNPVYKLSWEAIKSLILSIAMGNTAGLLPITPGGLGTRDAVVKATLYAGGFSSGDSIAMPLLFSAIMFLIYLLGGLFFLFHKRNKEKYTITSTDDNEK